MPQAIVFALAVFLSVGLVSAETLADVMADAQVDNKVNDQNERDADNQVDELLNRTVETTPIRFINDWVWEGQTAPLLLSLDEG